MWHASFTSQNKMAIKKNITKFLPADSEGFAVRVMK